MTYRGETVVLSVARDITTRKRYEATPRTERLLDTRTERAVADTEQVAAHHRPATAAMWSYNSDDDTLKPTGATARRRLRGGGDGV